jgi:hypothetical protein
MIYLLNMSGEFVSFDLSYACVASFDQIFCTSDVEIDELVYL